MTNNLQPVNGREKPKRFRLLPPIISSAGAALHWLFFKFHISSPSIKTLRQPADWEPGRTICFDLKYRLPACLLALAPPTHLSPVRAASKSIVEWHNTNEQQPHMHHTHAEWASGAHRVPFETHLFQFRIPFRIDSMWVRSQQVQFKTTDVPVA